MTDDDTNNEPDLDKVAYEVAIETIVRIYYDLRHKGLGRADAAAVVAYMLKSDDTQGIDNG